MWDFFTAAGAVPIAIGSAVKAENRYNILIGFGFLCVPGVYSPRGLCGKKIIIFIDILSHPS